MMDEQDITVVDSPVAVEEKPENVPVEDEGLSKLREQLGRLGKDVLTDLLERRGFNVAAETPKSELIEAIVTVESDRVAEADEQTALASEQTKSDDDPEVLMTFTNLECPGVDLEFTYSKKGFTKNDRGKVQPLPKWHFFDGRKYRVPYSVVKHLNSLEVPADKNVDTNAEGFITSTYTGVKKKRFACSVEMTDEQVRSLAKGT